MGIAVARNAVGPIGVLFFGWSAGTLAVLYFVDTLAGMAAVFAAVGFKLSNADPRRGVGTLVEGGLTALAVAGFLAAVVAILLGMPLVFLLGPRGDWRRFLADPTLLGGSGSSRPAAWSARSAMSSPSPKATSARPPSSKRSRS